MKTILFFLLSLVSCSCLTQSLSKSDLEKMEDEELLSYFNEVITDTITAEKVARVYLDRGRDQGDTIKMARGYDRLARIFNPKKSIMFADSIIALTKRIDNVTYPAQGYLLKSFLYHEIGNLVQSTKNNLKAYELALLNNNAPQQAYLLHYLVYDYSIWGDIDRALTTQNTRHILIESAPFLESIQKSTRVNAAIKYEDVYLECLIPSLQTYSSLYIIRNEVDSTNYYLAQADSLIKSYSGPQFEMFNAYSLMLKIESSYKVKDYSTALNLIEEYRKNNSNELDYNLVILNRMEGFCNFRIGRQIQGVSFLERADSILTENIDLITPENTDIYEVLLKYYRELPDGEARQIELLTKMIFADSIFKKNYLYFKPNLIKNFETPRLLRDKEALILGLRQKNEKSRIQMLWYLAFLSVVLLLLVYYINRQRIYKQRYAYLVGHQDNVSGVLGLHDKKEKSIISPVVVEDILESLERFERKRQYLSMDINLHDLAKSFTTNPNYLSRVINLKMEKNFSQYISDLRLEYAIVALQEDRKMRKYSIKAIANDCGFKSSESFSRAFYKKNGIYPSYYLKKLNREVG